MTTAQLNELIKEAGIALRWDDDVLSAWVPAIWLDEFTELVESFLSQEGAKAHLCTGGHVWVDLVPVCQWYGVEPTEILAKP